MSDAVLGTVKLSKYFEQVILVGYPPFVRNVLDELKSQGYDFSSVKFHIIVGGEGFPEEWRDYVLGILNGGILDLEKNLIASAYGAADAGFDIGYEVPLTIFLRREMRKNKELATDILGDNYPYIPHLFQFNPLKNWIESVNGELCFTTDTPIALVRYNIHDKGGVIWPDKLDEILSKYYDINQLKKEYKPYRFPLVYLYGRSDGVVTVSGANVYLENLKQIFTLDFINKYDLTVRFFTYLSYDNKARPLFNIICECNAENVTKDSKKIEEFRNEFVSELSSINSEFSNAYRSDTKACAPKIKFLTPELFTKQNPYSIKFKYIKE